MEKQFRNWFELNVKPYDKNNVDPYTPCRVITLNGTEVEAMLLQELPDPVSFKSNRECVRNVLASQIDLSADLALFVPMSSLPDDHRYHRYQAAVHGPGAVPSEQAIKEHRERVSGEYRIKPLGEHPIPSAHQAAAE